MNLKNRKTFLVNIAFWAVIVALVYLIFKYLIHLIMPFFLALIFAAIMRPVVRLLVKKLRFPQGVAGVVVTVLFFAVIGTLIALLTLRIISGLGEYATALGLAVLVIPIVELVKLVQRAGKKGKI